MAAKKPVKKAAPTKKAPAKKASAKKAVKKSVATPQVPVEDKKKLAKEQREKRAAEKSFFLKCVFDKRRFSVLTSDQLDDVIKICNEVKSKNKNKEIKNIDKQIQKLQDKKQSMLAE